MEISAKMDEFLDKVDSLCFEYGYEILPTTYPQNQNPRIEMFQNKHTITIKGNDEEIKILFIDGDGRGK